MAEKYGRKESDEFKIQTREEVFKCRIRWGGIDTKKSIISGVLEIDGKEVQGMYMTWNYHRYPDGYPGVFWDNEKSNSDLRSRLVRDLNIQKAVKTYFQLKLNEINGKEVQTQQQTAQATIKEPKKADDNNVINDAAAVLADIIDFGDDEIIEEPAIQLPNVGRCGSDDPKVVIANSKQAITKAEKAGCNAQLVSRLRNGLSAGKIDEVFIEDNVIKVLCGDRLFYGDPITGEVKKYG